jgi:hypothetical protein
MGIISTICSNIKNLLYSLSITNLINKNYEEKLIEKNNFLNTEFQLSEELKNLNHSRIDIPLRIETPKTKSIQINSFYDSKNIEDEIFPDDSLESIQYISNFEKDYEYNNNTENDISPLKLNKRNKKSISPIKMRDYKENNIDIICIDENNSEDSSSSNSNSYENNNINNHNYNNSTNYINNLFSKKIKVKSYENLLRTKTFKEDKFKKVKSLQNLIQKKCDFKNIEILNDYNLSDEIDINI